MQLNMMRDPLAEQHYKDSVQQDEERLTQLVCAILSSTGGEMTAHAVVKLAAEVAVEIQTTVKRARAK